MSATRKRPRSLLKTSPSSSDSLISFCKALKQTKSILLSCHILPEGDCIGSLRAMQSLLQRLGKKTLVVAEDYFPKRLTSCLNSKHWERYDDVKGSGIKFDALLVTDCPTLERIGKVRQLVKPETVIFNLDHHVSNNRFGHHNYILPKASATGEVVMDVFKYFKMKLTQEEAKNIYIAIATDTGSFRYSSTTARTHQLVSELINTGIDIESINDEINSNYSMNKIHLYSHLLNKIQTDKHEKIAWVAMTRDDVKRFGAEYEDSEGFIDFLKYIHNVKICFFASELPDQDAIRISFRSRGKYDVNSIATHFKGGGHRKSSGCLFEGGITLKESVDRVLERIRKDIDL
ncbi:MAG: bifunctional oligoribonuclease/PAP phosphatase NrnA [Candidatus Omnitrophica bacterium]|nr:bifunctional oligoribonuclease/PAP phosphatase NrnA [Candidatus Omnitrophota bacterium]